MAKLNYVELPVAGTGAAKTFYGDVFGWSFVDYGDDYAAGPTGVAELGLNGDASQRTGALLPVIEVDDLEATLAAVERAGGSVTLPIFAFPGGRRFHFRDVDGHELSAMQAG